MTAEQNNRENEAYAKQWIGIQEGKMIGVPAEVFLNDATR